MSKSSKVRQKVRGKSPRKFAKKSVEKVRESSPKSPRKSMEKVRESSPKGPGKFAKVRGKSFLHSVDDFHSWLVFFILLMNFVPKSILST